MFPALLPAAAAAAVCFPAHAKTGQMQGEVKLASLGWQSHAIVVELAALLLREYSGYDVQVAESGRGPSAVAS